MQSCKCRFTISRHDTYICTKCGLEKPFLQPNSTECVIYSLMTPYSRTARFRELLDKLLGMSSGPHARDPIWGYLAKGAPYKTALDIYTAIKLSDLKNKHYADLHIFCKCFLKSYIEPMHPECVRELREGFIADFEEVLHSWARTSATSFFSYNWLLEKMFKMHSIDCYNEYLKLLQCPARRRLYECLWFDVINSTGEDPSYGEEHSRPYPGDTPLAPLGIA